MDSKKITPEITSIVLMEEGRLMDVIGRAIDAKLDRLAPMATPIKDPVPLDEYVPKASVRGKLMSSSTLWKLERKGSLKTYAINGKRYYKRSEIENLIQEVKQ